MDSKLRRALAGAISRRTAWGYSGIPMVLLGVILSGCAQSGEQGGELSSNGPFVFLSRGVEIGMCPPAEGKTRANGMIVGKNESSSDSVVFESIALTKPDRVTLRDAYVVPFGTMASFGGGQNIPPDDGPHYAIDRAVWAERIPLGGATVAAGEESNILVGVVPGGFGASAEGVTLTYRVGDRRYFATTDVGVLFGEADDPLC